MAPAVRNIVCVILVFVAASRWSESDAAVNENRIHPFFRVLRRWGQNENNALNNDRRQRNERTWRQFIAATVVSSTEINNIAGRRDQTFPDGFEGRLVYLENLDPHRSAYRRDQPLHGEIQLMEGGYLDQLWNNYRADNPDENTEAHLMLYSYYIPCAQNWLMEDRRSGRGYSCAQQLARLPLDHPEYTSVRVQFSQIFERTDPTTAYTFMSGALRVYGLQREIDMDMEICNANNNNNNNNNNRNNNNNNNRHRRAVETCGVPNILQAALFQCFLKLPLSVCCVRSQNRNQIAAYATNHVTQRCTSDSSVRGALTGNRNADMGACMTSWIGDYVSADCPRCAQRGSQGYIRVTQLLVQICVDVVIRDVTAVGTPVYPLDMAAPAWKPLPAGVPWSRAYRCSPEEYLITNAQKVTCDPAYLSPAGMCTKTAPEVAPTPRSRSRVRG